MKFSKIKSICIFTLCLLVNLLMLAGCTFNPFAPRESNITGSPITALVGAGTAAGAVKLIAGGGSKPWLYPWIIGTGLVGGAFGYYVSTLRHDAGAILRYGGQVYKVGDFVGIYVPTDCLFESNTAEFLPKARAILDSVATVLLRYPNNNIHISGNTSGFDCPEWEIFLSEKRAERVAAFLFQAGIYDGSGLKLTYTGYGDYFPISSNLTNNGIRQNSRIQIVSYPSSCQLDPMSPVSS
jgi:hypothetical protein